MKGFRLLFAVCLAPLAFQGAAADGVGDAVRVAVRRNAANGTAAAGRQQTNSTTATNTTAPRTTRQFTPQAGARERDAATTGRSSTNTVTGARNDASATSARTTTNIISRTTPAAGAATSSGRTTARTATAPIARRDTARTAAPTARTALGAITNTARARATTGGDTQITRDDIMSRNYSKCRTVYYECMDEFCANKDSQLRRCACSSRVNEFDKVKKQLADAEEKMLDFNQRLLTVNMDKEDAAAIYTATEGELAFQQTDTSASKKMLDEIAKKLNTSFNSSNFDASTTSLSWSLNEDTAFDNIDSMLGATSTGKTGTALYSAALPVCLEMAAEVCSDDELAIAESGYQMMIEQDCNTVAKSYKNQTDQARDKIREGSALLDMSRLDIYQKRNSDDILTCKKKMLTMLSDTAVCGTDLGKCLDTSGKYIDPSTGEAFLTVDLANLSNLITRPEPDQTWTKAPGNEVFVSFLNSKKKYLEPAMESCQDIADSVWDAFVEDALAQIKLAQENKLETMRQSCTTLTAQCLTDTAKSLSDFDARALSTFGVAADKTVNAMCADVRTACSALLESTGGGDTDWVGGMTQIATDTTYETIIKTCREVGRACIIQACKSISGNFGLCENVQTSVNRKAIINRTSCWDDVKKCVESAGKTSINNIIGQLTSRGEIDSANNSFYTQLYGAQDLKITTPQVAARTCYHSSGTGITTNCVYDLCTNECGCTYSGNRYQCTQTDTLACHECRLTEKIWGNCEVAPTTTLGSTGSHNRIRIPTGDQSETLLSWFAVNTGTHNMDDSCRDTSCGIGYSLIEDATRPGTFNCVMNERLAIGDGKVCDVEDRINQGTNNENCCSGTIGTADSGHCCVGGTIKTVANMSLCMPANKPIKIFKLDEPSEYSLMMCAGTTSNTGTIDMENEFPYGRDAKCTGDYLLLYSDSDNSYIVPPPYTDGADKINATAPYNFYYYKDNAPVSCSLKYSIGKWTWQTDDGSACSGDTPKNWIIDYTQPAE